VKFDLRRKPFPIYPLLFAVFPILAIYSANIGLFQLDVVWRPVFYALGIAASIWAACALLKRSSERGSVMAAIIIWSAWGLKFAQNDVLFWIGVCGSLLIGWFVANWVREKVVILNRFAILLVAVASIRIGMASVGQRINVANPDAPTAQQLQPDIFWIVLDGHGRTDQIKRTLGIDNSGFIAALEGLGMTVSKDATANYCQTFLSVGSALNMAPIQDAEIQTAGFDINRPRLVRALRGRGYQSIAVGTGFPAFRFEGFDLVYTLKEGVNLFEGLVLEGFPISEENYYASLFDQRADQLQFGFDTISTLAKPTSSPRFVFAHILAPHPPFVFDSAGNRTRIEPGFSYSDGSDYITDRPSRARYRKGFAEQLRWVENRAERVIRDIKRHQKRPAIIIVMGDHGSKLGHSQVHLEATDLQEVFPILFAYSLPSGFPTLKGRTPLELLAPVFDETLGFGFSRPASGSWYSPKSDPRRLTDVTSRVK
jgi:Sulfatase